MHGAAVASIALGQTVGVAPQADLYYISADYFEPTVDGGRYKVRLDFGIAAVDYRGAVTNAGF